MQHAIYGGSNCERWLNCSGSTHLLQQVPRRPSNQPAIDGTAQHTVMNLLLEDSDIHPKQFVGVTIDTVKLTEDHIAAVDVALEVYYDLEHRYQDHQMYSERTVKFTEEAWGTADLMFVKNDHLVIADFKFGQGLVEAEANAQGLFYAIAARKTLRIDPTEVYVCIIQPAMDPALDEFRYTKAELDRFELQVRVALIAAEAPMPTYTEGEWCRWCDAKLVCPLKTQRLQTLTAPNHILNLVELGQQVEKIRSWAKWLDEAEERLHHELEHGTAIPGWKLVAKRATRVWKDEALTVKKLRELNVPEDSIFEKQLISPAQSEKRLKLKIADELAVSVSSGTTIAPVSDKRPEILSTVALGRAINQLI